MTFWRRRMCCGPKASRISYEALVFQIPPGASFGWVSGAVASRLGFFFKMKAAVEKFYSVTETALLLSLSSGTVIEKLKARAFGDGVINLAGAARPEYRIPASGINAWAESCRVFPDVGVSARTLGELRRKVAAL